MDFIIDYDIKYKTSEVQLDIIEIGKINEL
jgi:hypothetical protein